MMRAIQNTMRLQAQRALASVVSSRIGQVTSYDPGTFTARVQLQPDNLITGWLPIGSPWIGNGWGFFAAPNVGDMVAVEYINGDLEAGVVVQRFWNLQDLPLSVQSGELWIVHAKGGFFKLLNTGAVEFSDGHGAALTLDGAGNLTTSANQWNHTGPMSISGNVAITGTLNSTGDGIVDGVNIKTHAHTGVQSGSSTSGPPA